MAIEAINKENAISSKIERTDLIKLIKAVIFVETFSAVVQIQN